MKLPYLPNTAAPNQKQIVTFRGINYSDAYQDGDLRESLNVSPRRYPYLSTRRARQKQEAYSGASAMTVRGKLVVVQGTDLLYDGEVVGTVSEGEKQFAVVNTKLVIWPDKVYLDLNTMTVCPLGAKVSGTGAKFTASSGTITVSGWEDLTTLFSKGDGVTISGCATEDNNQTLTIKSITETTLVFGSNTLVDATESGEVTIERRVPNLDFICEAENRLWGCSNEDQTIYASAQGKPENFFAYPGYNTDAYALAVGSEGEFTGCCKLASSVLFWKESRMHKMLGSYPAEYTMYDYNIDGPQKGCLKSILVINEILYYLGNHGVYAYSGGVPALISDVFGEKTFTGGVAGSDGDSYYLSVHEGDKTSLLVYETQSGLWYREDDSDVVDFARDGRDLYLLNSKGEVWLADAWTEDKDVDWMAQFTPFHETVEGRKRFSKITMRLELPKGAWMKLEVRYDGGKWREVGKVVGRDADSIPLRLPLNRCDVLDVRVSGRGPCTIKAMMLEYSMGSDV